jgi:hypothetical protein
LQLRFESGCNQLDSLHYYSLSISTSGEKMSAKGGLRLIRLGTGEEEDESSSSAEQQQRHMPVEREDANVSGEGKSEREEEEEVSEEKEEAVRQEEAEGEEGDVPQLVPAEALRLPGRRPSSKISESALQGFALDRIPFSTQVDRKASILWLASRWAKALQVLDAQPMVQFYPPLTFRRAPDDTPRMDIVLKTFSGKEYRHYPPEVLRYHQIHRSELTPVEQPAQSGMPTITELTVTVVRLVDRPNAPDVKSFVEPATAGKPAKAKPFTFMFGAEMKGRPHKMVMPADRLVELMALPEASTFSAPIAFPLKALRSDESFNEATIEASGGLYLFIVGRNKVQWILLIKFSPDVARRERLDQQQVALSARSTTTSAGPSQVPGSGGPPPPSGPPPPAPTSSLPPASGGGPKQAVVATATPTTTVVAAPKLPPSQSPPPPPPLPAAAPPKAKEEPPKASGPPPPAGIPVPPPPPPPPRSPRSQSELLFSGDETTATGSEILHSSFEELMPSSSLERKRTQGEGRLAGKASSSSPQFAFDVAEGMEDMSSMARDLRLLLGDARHKIIAPAFVFAGQDMAKVATWHTIGRFYELASLGDTPQTKLAGERGLLMLATLARQRTSYLLRRMREKTYEGLHTPQDRPDILDSIAARLERPGLVFSGLYYLSTAILCRLTLASLVRKFTRGVNVNEANLAAFGRVPQDMVLRPFEQAFEETIRGAEDGTHEDLVIRRSTLSRWMRQLGPLSEQVVGTIVPCVAIASEAWLSLRHLRAAALLTRSVVLRTTYQVHQLSSQYVVLPIMHALQAAVLLFTAFGVGCFENMNAGNHSPSQMAALIDAANSVQEAEQLVAFTESVAKQWLSSSSPADKMDLDVPMTAVAASRLNTSF